jgi:hypothetical protein
MSKLVFETGLTYGDGRGSVKPVAKYTATVTDGNEDSYLEAVRNAFVAALEQLSDEEFSWSSSPWLVKFRPWNSLPEDEKMLMVWDYDGTAEIKSVPENELDAVKALVRDVLLSQHWSSFAYEEKVTSENVDEFLARIDWDAISVTSKSFSD